MQTATPQFAQALASSQVILHVLAGVLIYCVIE